MSENTNTVDAAFTAWWDDPEFVHILDHGSAKVGFAAGAAWQAAQRAAPSPAMTSPLRGEASNNATFERFWDRLMANDSMSRQGVGWFKREIWDAYRETVLFNEGANHDY